MKEFLAGWIVFQLIMIGFAAGKISNAVAGKTYVCPPTDKQTAIWTSIAFPLVCFMPVDKTIDDYCGR